jgi:hypothetical protein
VKTPLLPDIDLARIAPLTQDQKLRALEAFRVSHPPYRYVPLRKSLAEILNVQTGFLTPVERPSFSRIARAIAAESRSSEELTANLRVAQALYDYAITGRLEGRSLELFPLSIGAGTKLVFWHSFLVVKEGEPMIPFFDPRRTTTRLTAQARRFVFSTMHERIRASDPDFAEVKLAIFQFTAPEKGPRVPIMHTDQGLTLFSFEELGAMVAETYEIWTDVYARRIKTPPQRRAGEGFL